MSMPVTVQDLLAGWADAGAAAGLVVRGMTLDSRGVQPGDAFVVLRGLHHHGIEFAADACARGAVVVLAEAPAQTAPCAVGPVLWVADLGARLGEMAARFFGRPTEALAVTGVTGTNGKTSVVQLLTQAWSALGCRAASIGTLGAGLHGALDEGERTTPDAINVQRLLAGFRDRGVEKVAMEVSSHALVQGRVNGVSFGDAVFTNLSRDHLDYHGSMDAYFEAKAQLFAWPDLRAAIINVDDAHGRALAERLPAGPRRLRFGIEAPEAEIRADRLRSHADGFDFTVHTPWGSRALHSRLLGRFNVANLLAVVASLGAAGVDFDALCELLPDLEPIRGRMNRLGGGARPLVVIDYAHTPQALDVALTSLRPHTAGRLLCVFGAGGDRDRGKRPQMGAVVERCADLALITDDNPRSEDGDEIVAAIRAGFRVPENAIVQRDRARAIGTAIAMAVAGDVVLIAGKGHETSQEDRHGKHPFNDLDVAARALQEDRAC